MEVKVFPDMWSMLTLGLENVHLKNERETLN